MVTVLLSKAFYFTLADGDEVWPCTVDGTFRLSSGGSEHNVRGAGELDVSELEMIQGVLNEGKASRFRSKGNGARSRSANHFSVESPSVRAVHVNVGGTFVKLR